MNPVGLLKRLSQVRILPGARLAISRNCQASVRLNGHSPGVELWVGKAGLIAVRAQGPASVLAGQAPWEPVQAAPHDETSERRSPSSCMTSLLAKPANLAVSSIRVLRARRTPNFKL